MLPSTHHCGCSKVTPLTLLAGYYKRRLADKLPLLAYPKTPLDLLSTKVQLQLDSEMVLCFSSAANSHNKTVESHNSCTYKPY